MSLTRKASSAAKKAIKPPRQDLAAALVERETELAEARRQQAATAEILRVISRSPADAGPVFEAILEACQRLFGSDEIGVYTIGDDDMVRVAAWRGPRAEEVRRDVTPVAESVTGRIIRERRTHHIPDLRAEPNLSPTVRERVERLGSASLLYAPMLWEDRGVGSILVARSPRRPFSDREHALLQSFADQAAIAIENARLFNETQETLERQTATADILRVIASSPTDVRPVFEAIATSANRLLGGFSTAVLRFVGDAIHLAAFTPTDPMADEALRTSFPRPLAEFRPFLLVRDGETIQFADTEADHVPFLNRELARLRGYRSMLFAPVMSKGAAIGMISVTRKEPGDFAAHHVQLLKTFADQAVIAIENVRLFDEVQARTRDLEASLEQQTATADVLKAISRSAFDLETVLESLISTAMRLCNAKQGVIFRRHGDIYRYAASHMLLDPAYRAHEQTAEIKAGRGTLIGRVALENRTVQIEDAWGDPDYAEKDEIRRTKVRSMLGVPLLRNGEPIGAFGLGREEPVPFTQRQIELVTTFADQAVIAIENVRLFDEVQAKTRDLEEALQQQTATADVLKVISRSAFDLQAVFDTLTASAVELCGAFSGSICVRDGDVYRYRGNAGPGLSAAMAQYLAEHPATPGRGSIVGRVLLLGGVEEIPDVLEDADYVVPLGAHGQVSRALLGVPLLGKDGIEGALVLTRKEPGRFTPRQIEIVQTFADQAVIAIENVRLFDEVQARTRDLEEALSQQTATADVLKVISRSVSDAAPVFESILESCQRLLGLELVAVYLVEGKMVRGVARRGWTLGEWGRDDTPLAGSSTGLAIAERRAIHFRDLVDKPDLPDRWKAVLKESGGLTVLYAPMLLEDRGVGSIVVARRPARPFSEKEIALAQSFADQAVIAIQNARLFNEVKARTEDLSEALQQQTATADVLKVISRSVFDLQTVLDTLVESAYVLCGAGAALLYLRSDDGFECKAIAGAGAEDVGHLFKGRPIRAGRGTAAERVIRTGEVHSITDLFDDPDVDPKVTAGLRGAGLDFRSTLAVPMKRDDAVVGVLVIARGQTGPFPQRQVDLLQTFADQAVIAIENVRLFDEVQARTRDLSEALQQQTATADVLKVISRSMLDLDSVLQTLIDTAVRLARGSRGTIFLQKGDALVASAFHSNVPEALREYLANASWRLDGDTPPARAAREGHVVHIADLSKLDDENTREVRKRAPYGAGLWVPLIGERQTIGVFGVPRDEPIAFTDREIEIVQTFADQAVIAIENARLFREVQARTQELAASLDDLRKAQDRLIQSEKLASLGQLTAGIAHEIKNPLNFVNNFSALSRELVGELADVIKAAPLDDARREQAEELIGTIEGNLDKVVQHGKRADSIVKNMLLHSREGSGERSTTNVNAMVEEALNLAYHGARAEKPGFNVTIAKSLDPNAGAADLYPQEMTRVLLNLISNGFYATNKRKLAEPNGAYEPTLTASTRDLGQSVEIAIRDNGTGIADEVKAKMFNPFFTTKPAGEGTGLGLSLSHDIVVKQHGGTMEVESAVGAFTHFTIILPRAGEGL
jgi:GAF domain-containing protein